MRRPGLAMGLLLTQTLVWTPFEAPQAVGVTRFTSEGCLAERSERIPSLPAGYWGVTGRTVEGVDQSRVSSIGDAAIYRDGYLVTAPRIDYSIELGVVESEGPVCFSNETSKIEGLNLLYNFERAEGSIDNPVYRFEFERRYDTRVRPITVGGFGEKIIFEGRERYRIIGCRFTSCEGDKPDWYLIADEIDVNGETRIAEATNPRIYFKDVPILGLPWIDFPLDNRRRSGFLAPFLATSNRIGISVGLPYYWNIAPNYDATITPIYSTRRGPKIDTEFRYLLPNWTGNISFDYVPQDFETHTDRYAFVWESRYANTDKGVDVRWQYNSVSDLEYFSDFSNRIKQMTQSTLPREINVDYYLPIDWADGRVGLTVQRFQVLDPDIGRPYERMPQLTFELYNEQPLPIDWSFYGEYSNFQKSGEAVNGQRTVLHPTVSWPLTPHPGVSLTPKTGLNVRHYSLSDPLPGRSKDSVSVVTPITSVDAKAVFERDTTIWSRDYQQTLEPRLYYLYVPKRNQDDIPIFDTGLMDVNFASIFSENRYSGQDRIADANDLTFGLTSRLVDAENGQEVLQATLAQRFYFGSQHVGLPDESMRTDRHSDFLAGLSGRIGRNMSANTLLQYSIADAKFRQIVFEVQYHPEPGKTLSIGQRYYTEQYNQFDISGQWSITPAFRVVGRYSYSFRDSRNVETLFGLEYDSDCWVFRLIGQRIQTVVNAPTTAFFAQLELKGLGHIGPNPLSVLRRSIPGYQLLNDRTSSSTSHHEINRY